LVTVPGGALGERRRWNQSGELARRLQRLEEACPTKLIEYSRSIRDLL